MTRTTEARDTEFLTADEVVQVLRLPSKGSLYLMNHRGTGPQPIKFGHRTLRYRRTVVEAWLREREEASQK